jgi:hypothetical protein
VKDAFTIGEHLLVAPILTSSATTRRVSLPAGTWYALDTGEAMSGSVEIEVPLTEIGLFARAGAVIPTLPPGVQTLRASDQVVDLAEVSAREIWIWLGADGTARLGDSVLMLSSPARPQGSVSVVEGELITGEERRLVVRGASIVLEAGGVQHRATGAGDLTWIVRW